MAETHPILEAMARAMARELNAAESPGSDQLHVSWLNAALAAARVILSAEPSEGQIEVGTDAAQFQSDYVHGGSIEAAIRAYNAALLRELEGG